MIHIRNENENDYREVEEITRKAFYNLYVPGCCEHYLVHIMRDHQDFTSALDFVIEYDGKLVGNIMYTKAKFVDEKGQEKEILTFGPVSILPEYQRRGFGKMLISYSFDKAMALGYDTVVIFGNPNNYVTNEFKSCKKYNVCLKNGKYPTAMMVKELRANVLEDKKWIYYESPVMDVDIKKADAFDAEFETIEKKYQLSQEKFYIFSQLFLN